jgi:hypothetical protein
MIKLIFPIGLIILMSTAHAADPVKIELRNIHGLYGGQDLVLYRNGEMITRIVQPEKDGFIETRYSHKVKFEKIVGDLNLKQLSKYVEKVRAGIPDEVRPTIIIQLDDGKSLSYSKWEEDQSVFFDPTYRALLDLVNARNGNLEYEGPLDASYEK